MTEVEKSDFMFHSDVRIYHTFKLRHCLQKTTVKMYKVLKNGRRTFNPLPGHITTGSFVK